MAVVALQLTPLRPIKPGITAAKAADANSSAGWSQCKTNPRLLACRLICLANVRRLWAIFQVAGDESSVINLN